MLRFLLLSALVLFPLGCATGGPGSPRTPSPRRVALVVENQAAEDIVVELNRGTAHIPLGTVRARETRRFTLDPSMLGSGSDLVLAAHMCLGTTEHRSVGFYVSPGDRVEWEVEVVLGRSALTVR